MRRLLILVLGLSALCRVVMAQDVFSPDEILSQPTMLVSQLPDQLTDQHVQTSQGQFSYDFDPNNRSLLYQWDSNDIKHIALPDQFNVEDPNEVTLSSDNSSATFCNHPERTFEVSDSWVSGKLWIVDFRNETISYVEPCRYDLPEWGQPGVSYSGRLQSPDKEYSVSIVQGGAPENCVDEVPNIYGFVKQIRIETQSTSKKTDCILADGISFEDWTDNRHLAVRLYSPQEINAPISQLLLLSVETGELLSFGAQYEHYFPKMHFFDHNMKLARIAVHDENHLKPDHDCALNIVDFHTRSQTDIEPTTCIHRPEIALDEQNHQLIYLHYTIQDNPFSPQISLHRVDLDTGNVTPLRISGTLMDILQRSPTGNTLTLVIDQGETYWYAAQGVVEYDDPRWVVYDAVADKIIYEKPLLEINEGYDEPLYFDDIGPSGFMWTESGWRTLLLTDNKDRPPLYIASDNGIISETRLEPIPPSQSYDTRWSPDQSQLFIQAEDHSAYVLSAADQSVRQVFRPFDPGDTRVQVTWQDNLLLIEITQVGMQTTQGRWLIDPAK